MTDVAEQVDRLGSLASGMCQDAHIGIELVPDGWSYDLVRGTIQVSKADIERLGALACAGVLAHEVGHSFISRAHLFHVPFPSFRAWMMLYNGLEDPRVETWIAERYPGTGPWLDEANAGLMDRDRSGPPLPGFVDFTLECAAEEQRGWQPAPPRISRRFAPGVVEALALTRDDRRAYAETLPPVDLTPPADQRHEVHRAYLRYVAPELPAAASRVIPSIEEQVVRLSALEALIVAEERTVDVARELYQRDVERIAKRLLDDPGLARQIEQILEGKSPLKPLLDLLSGDSPASHRSPTPAQRRAALELGQRTLEGVIGGVQAGCELPGITIRTGGRGAGRIVIVSPLFPGGRASRAMRDRMPLLPPLRLDWQRDDYDQLFARISSQLRPLAAQVRRLLLPRKRMGERTGYPTGQRVDLRKLMAFEADPRRYDELWIRKTIPDRHSTEVLLLVDLSGSMRGPKTEAALAGTVLFAEMLNELDVPFAVYGFQDVIIPFIPFHQPLTRAARRQILAMRAEVDGTRPSGNNRPEYNDDGPCLVEAASLLLARPARDRVMIVISDGLPEGCRSDPDDLHGAIARLLGEPTMTLIGIGIGPDTEHVTTFYPHSIASVPLERFAAELGTLLETLLAR